MTKTPDKKPLILVVDDDPISVEFITGILKKNFETITATGGLAAMKLIREKNIPSLILLDILMPDISGYEVCKKLKSKKETRHIPIIFTTSLNATEDESKGLEAGAADYIPKPINPAILHARINTHLKLKQQHDQLERHVEKRTADLRKTLHTVMVKDSTIKNLMGTLDEILTSKNSYTFEHVLRVSEIATRIGKELDLNDNKIKALEMGGMLHDIGKFFSHCLNPLNGSSSQQTADTFDIHPEAGAKLFAASHKSKQVKNIILKHHERLDGSGFPKGIKADKIDQLTRIISTADLFTNMIVDHSDQKPASPSEAIKALYQEVEAGRLDNSIVEILDKIIQTWNPQDSSPSFQAEFVKDLINLRHLSSFREPLSNFNNYRYLLHMTGDALCRAESENYHLVLVDFLDLTRLNKQIGYVQADIIIDSIGKHFQELVENLNQPGKPSHAVLCRKGADYMFFLDLPEEEVVTLLSKAKDHLKEVKVKHGLKADISSNTFDRKHSVEKAMAELILTELPTDQSSSRMSELSQLCLSLDKAGVPSDFKWRSLVMYLRSLKDHHKISSTQKKKIQAIIKTILTEKQYSDDHFHETVGQFQAVLSADLIDELNETNAESAKLLQELKSMVFSRKGDVQTLENSTVNSIESGKDAKEIIAEIRDAFHDVVSDMEMDTARLECICNQDQLTGLNNRRAFDNIMEVRVKHSVENKMPLTLLFLDIDHFKNFNDTFGHQVGDQALSTVSKIIKQNMEKFREEDNLEYFGARYGGEEFTVIIPGFGLTESLDRAEAIRKNIEKYNFVIRDSHGQIVHKKIQITVSIGAAELNNQWEGDLIEGLIDAADQALYQAKDNGRNQVFPTKENR